MNKSNDCAINKKTHFIRIHMGEMGGLTGPQKLQGFARLNAPEARHKR